MAIPTRTQSRRAVLSYDEVKRLTKWPDLMTKDYQGILEDFITLADSTDGLSSRIASRPDNWQVVNKKEDFLVQDDTTITLEDNKIYIIGAPFTTDKEFSVGRNVAWTSFTFSSASIVTYTGSGTMFTGVDFENFEVTRCALSAPNALVFDFTSTSPGSGNFTMKDVTIRGEDSSSKSCRKFGEFSNLQIVQIDNASTSLDFTGSISLGNDEGITLFGTFNILSIASLAQLTTNSSCIGLDYRGATFNVYEISNFAFFDLSGSAAWIAGDGNSENIAQNQIATIRDCEIIGASTLLIGISSRDIRYNFQNCPPVEDSIIAGTLQFENSALTTTMGAATTPTHINAEWEDGEVEERLCFQDKLTFDGSTDVCTTANGTIDTSGGAAFNHGFTAGDQITLIENGGLPTGLSEGTVYYVGNLTATTFQLYPDDTLTTPVDFTGNGTEPNYYCHTAGTSKSGWLVYQAEISARIDIEGWVSLEKVSGGNADVRTVVMTTDYPFTTITRDKNGGKVNVNSGITGFSSISRIRDFSFGEGFMIYVENVTGTVDNLVTDASIVCTRV